MKVFASLLAAVALVASTGTTPLVAQGPASMSAENMNRVEVDGTITKIDKKAGHITIETATLPGIEGATMALDYTPTHWAALSMYDEGEDVAVDVIVTENGPKVESISSFRTPTTFAIKDSKGNLNYEIQAEITKIDGKTGEVTIETTNIPGHQSAKMTLSYMPSHPAALSMYHQGDKVLANLIVTENGPKIGWISSWKESKN